MFRPKLESVLCVLADPRFQPPYPYSLEEFFLQSGVTGKFRGEFNIGDGTDYQAFRKVADEALGSRRSKLRIVLPDVQEDRGVDNPSHGMSFTRPLPAILRALHRNVVAEDHALSRSSELQKDLA
jgi:hypothetical protein